MTNPSIQRHLRHIAFAISLFALSLGSTYATPQGAQEPHGPQGGPGRAEEIRSLKIAFFSDALQLSPEQSQKFWPVYNQYWNARREVGRTRRTLFQIIRDGKAGDQQFKDILAVMEAEQKVTADYIVKFRQILPSDKAAKVFVADEDFKNFLIRRAAGGGGPKK